MLSVPSSKMPSHVSKTQNLRKACSNHILRAEMPSDWNPPDHPPSWILLLASSQIPPFLELNSTWRLNNITATAISTRGWFHYSAHGNASLKANQVTLISTACVIVKPKPTLTQTVDIIESKQTKSTLLINRELFPRVLHDLHNPYTQATTTAKRNTQ